MSGVLACHCASLSWGTVWALLCAGTFSRPATFFCACPLSRSALVGTDLVLFSLLFPPRAVSRKDTAHFSEVVTDRVEIVIPIRFQRKVSLVESRIYLH